MRFFRYRHRLCSSSTLDLALHMIRCVCQPLERLQARDPKLADQLRRAASSVPTNLGEGRRGTGKDRLHLWRVAGGSPRLCDEARQCLLIAEAWGFLDAAEIAEPLELLDRLCAATWRLTH